MSSEKSSNPNYKLHKKLMRRRAIRESWPLLVWLGVAALALWAYRTGGDFQRMRGVVSKPVETVSAPIEGILVALPVDDPDLVIPRDEKGQPKPLEQGTYVKEGEVVAKIDDTMLRMEIDAEIETAQFDRAKLQQELQTQVLEFRDRVFQLENERQRVQDEITAQEQLKESVEREVKAGSALPSALEEVQAKINELTATLSSTQRSIAETEKLVEASVSSIEALQTQVSMAPEQSAAVRLLKQKVEQAVVRATNSGYIDKIWAEPGRVLKVGDPIMDIVVEEPKSITALIPEANALTLQQGDQVYIAIPNNRKHYVTATVLSLQQSLTQLPDYGSPIRGRMIRGRMVEFGNLGGQGEETQLPLLPGSEVIITLEAPGRLPFLSWFTE